MQHCACIDKLISEENTQRNSYTIHSHTEGDLNNSMWTAIDVSLKFRIFDKIWWKFKLNIKNETMIDLELLSTCSRINLYISTNFNTMMARILDHFDFNILWEYSSPDWICTLSYSARFNPTNQKFNQKKKMFNK